MYIFIVFSLILTSAKCWDTEDLEVFDAVEEVRENFYELLRISQSADLGQIKKAFRKLSLEVHPDKSSAPDAEIKFRNLVSVFEILKDPLKRSKYNEVLENGLPDWKHPVYYYRRYKKMGLLEMSSILFIIITIGQYLVAWAAYFEKKYAIEEFVSIKSKKLQKRQKKGKAIDMETFNVLPELVSNLPKPSVSGTLPVQICRLCWFLVVRAPPLTFEWIKDYLQRRREREAETDESSEEEVYVPRERAPRRRKNFTFPEREAKETNDQKVTPEPKVVPKTPVLNVGLWTDDDFLDLIRLMKKYPSGTQERWEKIGEAMKRLPSEVAHMAHKMKDGFKPVAKKEEEEEEIAVEEPPKKVKTKGGKLGEDADSGVWSQVQQKAFEQALAQYPKGGANDRWEKISKVVPGKTKEDCMLRFKYLADMVKKKKQTESPS